jgi:hypothetical protein
MEGDAQDAATHAKASTLQAAEEDSIPSALNAM